MVWRSPLKIEAMIKVALIVPHIGMEAGGSIPVTTPF